MLFFEDITNYIHKTEKYVLICSYILIYTKAIPLYAVYLPIYLSKCIYIYRTSNHVFANIHTFIHKYLHKYFKYFKSNTFLLNGNTNTMIRKKEKIRLELERFWKKNLPVKRLILYLHLMQLLAVKAF